jgi:hypothetical protein
VRCETLVADYRRGERRSCASRACATSSETGFRVSSVGVELVIMDINNTISTEAAAE